METAPSVLFDPERHLYWQGGRLLPGVTAILEATGIADYSFIDGDLRDYALARGTAVHTLVKLIVAGTLDWSTIDPVLEPYLWAFESFRADTGIVPRVSEVPLADPTLGYAGTPDLGGPLAPQHARTVARESDTVLDVKSGEGVERSFGVQTAAYQNLLYVGTGVAYPRREILRLSKTGKYHRTECKDRQDWKEFQAGLFLYQRRNGGLVHE